MAIRNTSLGGEDYQDTGSTTLTSNIDDSVTTIPVDSTTGFKSAGELRIGTEIISYTSTDATNFLGATRGAFGTTAVSHLNNDAVLEREVVKAVDINDTFDALVDKVQTLTTFWLNDELYDVYDDFSFYSVSSNIVTNSLWEVTLSAPGASNAFVTVETSTIPTVTGKVARVRSQGVQAGTTSTATARLKPILNVNDKHYAFLLRYYGSRTFNSHVARIDYNGGNFTFPSIASQSTIDLSYFVYIIAKGDSYDIYVNGFKHATVANTELQLSFFTSMGGSNTSGGGNVYLEVEPLKLSKGTVQ